VQWELSLPSVFGVELRLSDTSPSRIPALTPSGACVSRFTKHLTKESETVQDEEILRLPTLVRTDNTPTVRFSATLGKEPEIELALV
jgi:hypothetical protein